MVPKLNIKTLRIEHLTAKQKYFQLLRNYIEKVILRIRRREYREEKLWEILQ